MSLQARYDSGIPWNDVRKKPWEEQTQIGTNPLLRDTEKWDYKSLHTGIKK